MQVQMQIPSRLQKIEHPVFKKAGVELFMKREDEIHPYVSGNKWRKLKYNIAEVKASGKEGFVTFGGAFSNHLTAAAYSGYLSKMKMIGLVRGEEADLNNPTLRLTQNCGMQLKCISREQYALKTEPEFLENLQNEFPDLHIIPEGGGNLNGVRGCMEILPELDEDFDIIACPIGTSTTFSGLLLSAKSEAKIIGFPAVKGGEYLLEDVNNFINEARANGSVPSTFTHSNWFLQTRFHFGGFGRVNQELIQFMNDFWAETSIPLDPIYTGKMMFGLVKLLEEGEFEKGSRILSIHTGGLQGISGMNYRLRNKGYRIEYEKDVVAAFPDTRN